MKFGDLGEKSMQTPNIQVNLLSEQDFNGGAYSIGFCAVKKNALVEAYCQIQLGFI